MKNLLPNSEPPVAISESAPGDEPLSAAMPRLTLSQAESRIGDNERKPVYLQDWWLNHTAPLDDKNQLIGNHRLSVIDGGAVVGTMTYTIFKNRLGVKEGRDPILSRVGGPLISEYEGDIATQQRRRDKIVSALIAQLPINVSHIFTLPPNSTDHTLFMAAGFSYDYEYSYRIPPGDANKIRAGLFRKLRSRLRKAETELDIAVTTPEKFIEFYADNLKFAGLRPVFPLGTAHHVLKEALQRGQARVTMAHYKGASTPVAALAAVWDEECYYTWLATYRLPEKPSIIERVARRVVKRTPRHNPAATNIERRSHPCALRFLFWNAMLDAHSRGLIFDLDGTRKTETEHLYKEFNGVRVIRHVVSRETLTYRFWAAIRRPLTLILKNSVGLLGPFFH